MVLFFFYVPSLSNIYLPGEFINYLADFILTECKLWHYDLNSFFYLIMGDSPEVDFQESTVIRISF